MSQYSTDKTSAPGSGILTISGNTGGPVGPDIAGNVSFVGIVATDVTGSPGANQLIIRVNSEALEPNEIPIISTVGLADHVYITNNAALVTITLISLWNQGEMFKVIGKGTGFWKLQCNAGQTIHFNESNTSVGGYIQSTQRYSCIKIQCITDNTDFVVTSAEGGAFIVA